MTSNIFMLVIIRNNVVDITNLNYSANNWV